MRMSQIRKSCPPQNIRRRKSLVHPPIIPHLPARPSNTVKKMSVFLSRLTRCCVTFLILPSLVKAYICHPATTRLPTEPDCLTLVDGLAYASQLYPAPKTWGRYVAPSALTETLPKWYWIETPPPITTCAIVVDIARPEIWAVETFPLLEVARAAMVVFERCLLARGQVGLEFVEDTHVYTRLVRNGRIPWLRESLGLVRRLQLLDGSFLLEGQSRGINASALS